MKTQTPYEKRIGGMLSGADDGLPSAEVPCTAAAIAALSSALRDAFIRLTRRRKSPKSLRLL